MIPARRRLLSRLGTSEPRVVQLCAPAGYGKADFAASWARRFDRHCVCNCANVAGTIDLAGRVMSALADESRGGGEGIARTRLFLHATEADAGAWSRALLEGWKQRQERALLVLENADAIASTPDALALLGDMFAARPAERVLLVVSRRPLPLDVTRYLAPHQILTIARDELKFDDDGAASMFDGADLAKPIVDRIVQLAGGHPIALLLLARIAHYEADVERLLERLAHVPGGLHEYLLNEVLSALTPDMTATMLAAAAIPGATLEDISLATEIAHAAPVIEGLLRLPGFIAYESGAYTMHPLLHSALRARHDADFAGYVLRAARGNERLGDFLRAAELYNVAGDAEAAAAALDRLPAAALQQPSPRTIDAIAKVPVSAIVRWPNLWMATLAHRHQIVGIARLHRESIDLLQDALPESAPALYRRLAVRRAMLACERNRLIEARAALESVAPIGSSGETPEDRRIFLMTSALVAAKQGRFFDADLLVEEGDAVHGARHLRFEEELVEIAMEKACAHGDWAELLKLSEERLAVAARAGPTERIAGAAREVARAAWLANDDDRVAAAQQIVKDCNVAPLDPANTAAAALADWQTSLATTSPEHAAALLDRAIERFDASESDFQRIAARVCAAFLVPAQRRRLYEAREIAAAIESAPLQTSLELLIDSPEPRDFGIFASLAARVARSPLKARRDQLFVDVVRGQVRRGTEVLHVSDRGLELLAALALFDWAAANEELAAAIWPTLDRKAAVNSLKMCVSRTRAQVGDRESIQNARSGYVLGERVGTDVRDIERVIQRVRGAGTIGESTRLRAQELLATWSDRPLAHSLDWGWFAPYATHLAEMRRELAQALAKDAARREANGARQAVPT